MKRAILHVDMDAFFVAVEVRANEALRGLPVIVGGSPGGRGVVCSASYEARAFGVKSAMAMSRAMRLCPRATVVPVGTSDYGAAAREVRGLWRELTPSVELMSIDEAYLDLTGTRRLHGDAVEAADRLIRRTRRELDLPCSVGVAENKLLAKVASDYAKPLGLLRVEPGAGAAFLSPLPLRRLPGLGPKLEKKLSRYGLETLGELVALGRERLVGALGESGEQLWRRAQGRDTAPLRIREPARSISRETTFDVDTTDPVTLDGVLSWLSERVAAALRREQLMARTLTLKLRYSDFTTMTRSRTLSSPTDDDRVIYDTIAERFQAAHSRRVRVRLLGVGATNLCDRHCQFDLFEAPIQERNARLGEAFDAVSSRHGSGSLRRARSLNGRHARAEELRVSKVDVGAESCAESAVETCAEIDAET